MFKKGCGCLIVVALIILVAVGFIGYFAYQTLAEEGTLLQDMSLSEIFESF